MILSGGGLAATLNEIAAQSGLGILIEERSVPIQEAVKSLAELLGFDPFSLANEGKVVLIVAPEEAEKVMAEMRGHKLGKESRIIREIVAEPRGKGWLRTLVGGTRILDMPRGEQLPRIC